MTDETSALWRESTPDGPGAAAGHRRSMSETHVLVVEDGEEDAEYVRRLLSDHPSLPCRVSCVDRLASALELLAREPHDVALLDLNLPDSRGLETVSELCREAPGLAVIAVTGSDDEQLALHAVQNGAQDYLLKGSLTRDELVRSIRHSLERHRLVERLREARRELSVLESLLPVCPSCKMVRTDGGTWMQVDQYLRRRTGAEISHALCPRCCDGI